MERSGIPAIPVALHDVIARATPIAPLLFPPFGRVTFFARPKKGTKEKGAKKAPA